MYDILELGERFKIWWKLEDQVGVNTEFCMKNKGDTVPELWLHK